MLSRPHQARGVLIALEGIDGTGKSTQAARLLTIFSEQGYDTVLLREPSDSPWGRRLREVMRTGRRLLSPAEELDLFLQDRRYDVAVHIRPALAACKLVLMDRYYFSTIAYQGALGIDPAEIQRLNEAFAPVPDAVFVLLIAPATALERIRRERGGADDVFEREDYLTKVDEVFRTLSGPNIHPIAADEPIEVMTSILQEKIREVLRARHFSPHPDPLPRSGEGTKRGAD